MVFWLLSAFVAADLQVLVEKLAEFGIDWIGSALRHDKKLERLIRTLANLQSFIHDAEDTQAITGHAWETLLHDFEDVRYEVEDLFDEFVTEMYKLEGGSLKKMNLLVGRLPEQTIEVVQEKMDDMLKKLDRLEGRPPDVTPTKLPTTSFINNSDVFGRDTDITNFLEMLERSEALSTASNITVVPIQGVIGVGKTTLAQLIYNSNMYNQNRFGLKIWVSVPVNFDVASITRLIIEEANRQSLFYAAVGSESLESLQHHLTGVRRGYKADCQCPSNAAVSSESLESLQHHLAGILRGYKFLLVLDDLWNVKQGEWDLLLKPLNHGERGSKIIVTTRSRMVSKLVATTEQYELKCLSSEVCWVILKGEVSKYWYQYVDFCGLEIARLCEGLPLAAKIVGQQLPDDYNLNHMIDRRKVLKIWELPEIKSEAALALQWGHFHLPRRLWQCFAYCTMFPQSYEFEKLKIIRMWMGGGLIICDQRRNTPEELGSYYIHQLLENSFFETKDEKYIIHAAVHRLFQSFSSDKFLRIEETSDSRMNERTKHISLSCDNMDMAVSKVHMCKCLRSLILFVKNPSDRVPLPLFGLGSLRVLDLSGTQIKDLTGSIGNLIHLRFLDLSSTLLKWLPETIKELRALQTLVLTNSPDLLHLPDCTCKLISLLHLQLGENNRLSSMPSGIGKLIGLQTINEFIVGSKKGQINELKNLNNIRGSLCLKQLENVEDALGDLEADLASKKNLESLEFQWSSADDARKSELVLGNLVAPCVSLKQLVFTNYGGAMFPQWVSSSSFSELVTVGIYDCKNCELLPTLGKLQRLKFLTITGMESLEKVDELFYGEEPGFPSLDTLEFRDMPELKEWTGARDRDMAHLRKLAVADCPQLINIPSLHHFRCLEELEFEDCPVLPLLAEQTLASSVKSLSVLNCSLLEDRYNIGSEDWIKVEHIPTIIISGSSP